LGISVLEKAIGFRDEIGIYARLQLLQFEKGRRENIRDKKGNVIGDNSYQNFNFTNVAFSVVPSWGMMVGDIEGNIDEAHGLDYS